MADPIWQGKAELWKKRIGLVLLVGALATGLALATGPAHGLWFLLGFLLAVVLLAPTGLRLLEPPSPPPGKRLRLINCDPSKHITKLHLWAKQQEEDPDWRTRTPVSLVVDLGAPRHLDLRVPDGLEVLGLCAAVDTYDEGRPQVTYSYATKPHEQPMPLDSSTVYFHPAQIVEGELEPVRIELEPNRLREGCPR